MNAKDVRELGCKSLHKNTILKAIHNLSDGIASELFLLDLSDMKWRSNLKL
jgi:hypothetical protein